MGLQKREEMGFASTMLQLFRCGRIVFTARAYARAVLGVVILSVCPFVRLSHAWIVTKLNDALRIFSCRTKAQSPCFSDTYCDE